MLFCNFEDYNNKEWFINYYYIHVCVLMCLWDLCYPQVVCGRRPCLSPGTPGRELHSCPGGRECLEHNFLTCLSPPCNQWGFCSSPEATQTIQTKCEPNTVYLDKSCARITLIFNRDKLPTVSILLILPMRFHDVCDKNNILHGTNK